MIESIEIAYDATEAAQFPTEDDYLDGVAAHVFASIDCPDGLEIDVNRSGDECLRVTIEGDDEDQVESAILDIRSFA